MTALAAEKLGRVTVAGVYSRRLSRWRLIRLMNC